MLTTTCSPRLNRLGFLQQNGVHQAWLGFLLIFGSAGMPVAQAQTVAVTPDQVLLTLSSQSRSTREALHSNDIALRLRAASEEVQQARRSGDSRHAGRAESLLATLPARDDVQLLRANVQQYQHRFSDAQQTLNMLLTTQPPNSQRPTPNVIDALVMSAQIAWLTADFNLAKKRCAALLTIELLLGKICQLYTASSTGQLDEARKQLTALDVGSNSVLQNWQQQLLADMADRAGDNRNAERRYLTALSFDQEQHSARAALADLYLRQQKFHNVISLVQDYNHIDALALRLLYAKRQLGQNIAAPRDALIARYQLINARGDVGHEREHALLQWYLLDDRATALDLAKRNFSRQKEMIDLRLLAQLASILKDNAATQQWRDFMHTQHYQDRQVDTSL